MGVIVVTGLVRDYLTDLVQDRAVETRFDRLQKLQDEILAAIRARGGGLNAADNHPKEALHRRDALR